MFDNIKSPAEYGLDWITDKLINDFVTDLIAVFPILIGMSVGVYALLSMLSKRLANAGVIGVFVYGALIVIA